MSNYPTHEVWGGFADNGECDEPRHLEDCFSKAEADAAAIEWAGGKGRYAFVRLKDESDPAGDAAKP